MASLVAQLKPLITLAGPTASGKTALALALAERFAGEIVSCDSVAVYRHLEIGTAKPTHAERRLVPHHLLDVFEPNEPCTAGAYSRLAREALLGITERHRLPIVAGGTGLYLRALLDGLFDAPPRNDRLRTRLRQRPAPRLHHILARLDPSAAAAIHPNDAPKLIRAIEVTLAARSPISHQWAAGRGPLTGYRPLRLYLAPPRAELYDRIDRRAAEMFSLGLVEETALLVAQYGYDCRPLSSLGYRQAIALLRKETTRDEAVRAAQQGHRNYAKRQLTWFRREPGLHWLEGFGGDPSILEEASAKVAAHLATT